jgi:hypothetical protein
MVHRLITQGTFEERVDAIMREKQQLREAFSDGGTMSWLADCGDEALRNLFALRGRHSSHKSSEYEPLWQDHRKARACTPLPCKPDAVDVENLAHTEATMQQGDPVQSVQIWDVSASGFPAQQQENQAALECSTSSLLARLASRGHDVSAMRRSLAHRAPLEEVDQLESFSVISDSSDSCSLRLRTDNIATNTGDAMEEYRFDLDSPLDKHGPGTLKRPRCNPLRLNDVEVCKHTVMSEISSAQELIQMQCHLAGPVVRSTEKGKSVEDVFVEGDLSPSAPLGTILHSEAIDVSSDEEDEECTRCKRRSIDWSHMSFPQRGDS